MQSTKRGKKKSDTSVLIQNHSEAANENKEHKKTPILTKEMQI